MQYSVVNFNQLQKGIRIDADYYLPEFLKTDELLNNATFSSLNEFCNFCKKGIFDISPDYYREEGVPLIRTSEIKDPLLNFTSTVYLDEDVHKIHKKTQLTEGDIVFTKIGAYIGDVAILPPKFPKYNFSQNVTGLSIKKDRIESGFLLAYLLSKFGRNQILRVAMLSGQGKLELEDIRNLKIANVSQSLRGNIHKLVFTANQYKENSSLFYLQAEQLLLSELGLLDWKPKHTLSFVKNFSDTKESNRFDAEYFQPKYEEIIEAVKKYQNGFDELGNLVKIKKSVEPGSDAYQEKGIPFVRVSNLSKFELSDNNQQFISEELYEELKTHQPKKGEILLSKDATLGMAYYLNEEPQKMIVSGGILRLKMDSKQILPEYLTLVLNSVIVQKQIERDAGGSIINHWRPDQVKATLIPILKEDKQKEIKELIEKSFNDKKLSKSLLEIAKRSVEIAIEKDEQTAEKFIEWAKKEKLN